MQKNSKYDVICIGAGSGGLNIAGFMNRAGFKVLLIDKEDRAIGGDCLNYGCVPSKALIHVAREVASGKHATQFGLTLSGAVDLEKVMHYVHEKQEHIRTHENAAHFRALGMDVALGNATFVDHETVMVGAESYTGKKIVIATGSTPRPLQIPGIQQALTYTNETIFNLKKLPQHLVVVGAGPIGVELGQAFAMLGSKVTIIGSKLLEKEDPELVAPLQRELEKCGIELMLQSKPERYENDALIVKKESGETISVPCDAILVSIGREASVRSLNCEAAGIALTERGTPVVNEYLQTTNKRVYVCGDAAGQHQFTHAAEVHTGLIIRNFFSPWRSKLNTDTMSWVTYTTPEIATFGLDEATLKKRGITFETLTKTFEGDDRAIVDGTTDGILKVRVSKRGVLLGGGMVAHNAGELAQELMLAQAHGLKLSALLRKIYPYPTATRINRALALEQLSKRLTVFTKKILKALFH